MLHRMVVVSLMVAGTSSLVCASARVDAQTHIAPNINLSQALTSRLSLENVREAKRQEILKGLNFFTDRRAACVAPPQTAAADIDVHRSLFVHDRATLDSADFSLSRTLDQLALQVSNKVPGTTAVSIFRQLWDTQNPAPGATAGPHCTDNGGTVNGFPNSCRTNAEGQEALGADAVVEAKMRAYLPLALVNRLDLAHEGWRNCGEFRIIYGKPVNGIQRNFVIFEAVLPNPKPGCREGCAEVAKFWKSLSAMNDPVQRAAKLEQFFYKGLPGYRRVVHVDHYSAKGVTGSYGSSGSGQIRTNQFMSANPFDTPWMLKEFKTVIDCGATPCKFDIVPIMVKVNPFGELWNEDIATNPGPLQALAADFQSDVVLNTGKLASGKLMDIGYPVDLEHDAAQSFSLAFFGAPGTPAFVDNYRDQFHAATGSSGTFRNNLAAAATNQGLTADQIVNRAMTQTCAGCHMPSTFGLQAANSIGPAITPAGTLATSWPDALRFVHVDAVTSAGPLPEFSSGAFGNGLGQPISPALHEAFLPDRRDFMLSQLNAAECKCRNRPSPLIPRDRVLLPKPNFDLAKDLDLHLDLRPHTLQLNAAQLGGGNVQRERALRQQQVIEIVKEEPPRRTVTNSFRVH
jgi:hypothetical protein